MLLYLNIYKLLMFDNQHADYVVDVMLMMFILLNGFTPILNLILYGYLMLNYFQR